MPEKQKNYKPLFAGGGWADAMDRDLERNPPVFVLRHEIDCVRNIAFSLFDGKVKP
jgi:hypothetical protein